MYSNYIIFLFFSLICTYATTSFAGTANIFFLKNGVPLKSMNLSSLKDLQKDEVLSVFEPHENSQKKYKGFSVLPLMDSVYGKNKAPLDTLVFYCEDGYRSDIPFT